jgi:excisionase family DNA binding protein
MKSRKRTKTTEITVERSNVFIIRKLKRVVFARCEECAARVQWLTPDEAAVMAHISVRTVYRWVESRKVHFTETPEGLLLVCRNSLC